MTRIILCGLCFMISTLCLHAQERVLLYPNGVPNAKPAANLENETANAQVDSLTHAVSIPSLTVFTPPKGQSNGTAVIICPGGGYHVLLTKREGSEAAKAFNSSGVTVFVLRYRLPDDGIMIDKTIGPLQDAQQAIKFVRENAVNWDVDPDKIGIMGYSAGGHLASSAGVHYESAKIENENRTSLRPDFMLLINPVISFSEEVGHVGSRDKLLGLNPPEKNIRYFSSESHVRAETPPTFLVHAGPDEVVPVENSLRFYQALKQHRVPAGLYIYPTGEHGFLTSPSFEEWFGRCLHWMKSMNFL